jgi:hypothetical protein
LSALGDKTDYAWDQALWYFSIGALKACGYALVPVLVAIWHNYNNYSDPMDWGLIWKLAVSGVGLKLLSYWNEHKALLKMPPFWAIPPEFEPRITVEKSEHTTVQTVESPGVKVTTELSPHTTTTVVVGGTGDGTKPAE